MSDYKGTLNKVVIQQVLDFEAQWHREQELPFSRTTALSRLHSAEGYTPEDTRMRQYEDDSPNAVRARRVATRELRVSSLSEAWTQTRIKYLAILGGSGIGCVALSCFLGAYRTTFLNGLGSMLMFLGVIGIILTIIYAIYIHRVYFN